MSLKDFRNDPPDFDDDTSNAEDMDTPPIQGSSYHEEINTLKIDKLSNRVTIISIIIPCLICVILVFAYLDIKERVVDVDTTKQSQYEKISRQLDEKLNALDVKIAKNRYDIDDTLPALEKKSVALEGQMTKKADSKTLKGSISKLERRVGANAKLAKSMNDKALLTLKKTQDNFDKTAKQIKDEITLFKEEFDARLLELSQYEQQIGELRKNLSLMDKKQRTLSKEAITKTQFNQQTNQIEIEMGNKIKALEKQLNTVNQKLNANISRFQKDLDLLMKSNPSFSSGGSSKPSPQINIDSSDSEPVQEEPLSQ